jgi:hypothetical protein
MLMLHNANSLSCFQTTSTQLIAEFLTRDIVSLKPKNTLSNTLPVPHLHHKILSTILLHRSAILMSTAFDDLTNFRIAYGNTTLHN